MDNKLVVDVWSQAGERVEQVQGHIESRNVYLRYPTRNEHPVLRGSNFKVRPGQYAALVGASGCSKRTSIQLLERFYNPTRGSILLDERPIHTLNMNDYRGQIALVSQELTLYHGTIRENISLESPDESVSDERINQACINANIHNFIISLPNGLDTIVGSKGGLLSGGQKQRIVIARALIRNPKILLLDEATSALDSESEVVVQAALDKAAKGRTTISVAHRLSSIQNADVIFVFNQGQVIGHRTHKQRNGHYAKLVGRQKLEDEM